MHLLFLSRPDRGHRYPTLRLAEELGRRGHQVTFVAGDPDIESAGVRLMRLGQDVRGLLQALAPVDAVVTDPRALATATTLGDVPVIVAGTNLPGGYEWPGERAHDNYVFALPGAQGALHDPWQPGGRRPVLLVDGPSIGPLVRAFGETDWQVVIGDSTRFAGLPHADVFLTDGRLPAVSAALRAGVPMALAPRTAEEVTHAEQVAELGVGTVVVPEELPADALRQTVEHLRVDEPTLASARRLSALVETVGAPEAAADRVTDLLAAPPLARAEKPAA
jgi:hypothetical protein